MASTTEKPKVGIFRETSGSVKNLRRHYKNPSKTQYFRAIQSELTGSSDRSAVILVSASIETALIDKISKSLRFLPNQDQADKIYRFEGPLDTHSARCEIAWLMGFIDDRAFAQLDYLRELRNACAHSAMPMSLTDQKVYNVAEKIFYPLGVLDPKPFSPSDSKSLRNSLIMEMLVMVNLLKLGSRKEAVKFLKEKADVEIEPSRYS